jgi:hypothetical protein
MYSVLNPDIYCRVLMSVVSYMKFFLKPALLHLKATFLTACSVT